jgi:hypothetical protein
MKKLITHLFLSVLLIPLFTAQPVLADDHRHGHWHGDIKHFDDHDRARWEHGHWYHGAHQGRNGWWWVLDAGWYFYPQPVYPYPNPFVPPVAGMAVAPAPLPTVVAAKYYYCTNPRGYYPYVPACYRPWRLVVTP